jgi:hypothetical protein
MSAVMLMLGAAGNVLAGGIQLTPSGSFQLQTGGGNRNGFGGLAADSNAVYEVFTHDPEMDIYSTSGTFVGTVPLSGGPSTLLGGYTGATVMDDEHLLLTAMSDDSRRSSIYVFTKGGVFVSQTVISPAVRNTTSIAFDGTSAYVAQNDLPNKLYRVNVNTGTIQQEYSTNPGHGQRLGLDYWKNGNVLFESYDQGLSVIDPGTGLETQHFTTADLGYSKPFQTFGVAIANDDLYLMTPDIVFKYIISGVPFPVPEPSSLFIGSTALLLLLGVWWRGYNAQSR